LISSNIIVGSVVQYGLYSAIGVCFVYALLGTSREMVSGPGAIMALLAAQYGQTALTGDVRPLMLLTFLSGIVQLTIAVFNGGEYSAVIIRLTSNSAGS
jgi:MFS superfamily sulfate permease-like transporter